MEFPREFVGPHPSDVLGGAVEAYRTAVDSRIGNHPGVLDSFNNGYMGVPTETPSRNGNGDLLDPEMQPSISTISTAGVLVVASETGTTVYGPNGNVTRIDSDGRFVSGPNQGDNK